MLRKSVQWTRDRASACDGYISVLCLLLLSLSARGEGLRSEPGTGLAGWVRVRHGMRAVQV
eukprot:6307196-Prymnesium_polylepis.1